LPLPRLIYRGIFSGLKNTNESEVKNVRREIRILVNGPNLPSISIAQIKGFPLAKALKWLGKAQKVTVIVPEGSVETIEIKEF